MPNLLSSDAEHAYLDVSPIHSKIIYVNFKKHKVESQVFLWAENDKRVNEGVLFCRNVGSTSARLRQLN